MADVASLPARTLALHDDSELSLAGLEDKILLVGTPDGWARPVHGYPSIFTVVIADADAHGKNISLLHPTPEHVALAPLYDTVPTALWPRLRPTAAMYVNGRAQLADVTAEDLLREARRWGLGSRVALSALEAVSERLRAAAAQLPARDG